MLINTFYKEEDRMKKLLVSRIASLTVLTVAAAIMTISISGCGKAKTGSGDAEPTPEATVEEENKIEFTTDIKSLTEQNEDIFAWLRIPGTNIDYPILQSGITDDYYESHNEKMEEDEDGALYIEMANMMDMCDFNTVIHGKQSKFNELYKYADPEFFGSNGEIFVFLDGNVLTYQVFAAYERDNTSLIRTYDFSYISGCQEFLDDLYNKEIGKNLLEDWGVITPYNFCITLTTQLEENSDKQYVVVAALVNDEAGTINRDFME